MGDEELIPWTEVSRVRKKAVQRARDSPASDQLDEHWSRACARQSTVIATLKNKTGGEKDENFERTD
jgi:hypothetical protein